MEATPVQVVCETHSELFVVMLTKLVERGRLGRDDIAFVAISAEEDGTRSATRVEIDEKGRFTHPWPGGFFLERRLIEWSTR